MNPEFARMVAIFGIARKPEWEVWMTERSGLRPTIERSTGVSPRQARSQLGQQTRVSAGRPSEHGQHMMCNLGAVHAIRGRPALWPAGPANTASPPPCGRRCARTSPSPATRGVARHIERHIMGRLRSTSASGQEGRSAADRRDNARRAQRLGERPANHPPDDATSSAPIRAVEIAIEIVGRYEPGGFAPDQVTRMPSATRYWDHERAGMRRRGNPAEGTATLAQGTTNSITFDEIEHPACERNRLDLQAAIDLAKKPPASGCRRNAAQYHGWRQQRTDSRRGTHR